MLKGIGMNEKIVSTLYT